jgi:predicted aspartyl protease
MQKIATVILLMSLYSCGGSNTDSGNETTPPPQNSTPQANAGPDQNISTSTVATLNGNSSSDADGDTISYSWSLTTVPSGSNASLVNPTNISPTFTADIDGSYIAQLIVNDGTVDSTADTVTIAAATANSAPMASAGPDQNIATTSVVTLNGSASSDADGDAISYSWSLTTVPSGSDASLVSTSNVSPTFTADVDGSYIAQLIVNDGTVDSTADTVTIAAATANSAPMASAGPDQNIATTSVVTLNGNASSDADVDAISYSWSLTTVPSGSDALLVNTTNVSPTFTADIDGSYIVQLIVNDGTIDSTADTVTIAAATANSAPMASAGPDQNIATTSVVTLNGNASSDADGDAISYSWSLTTVPSGSDASLVSTTNVSPTFTADIDGSYIAQLIVNDGTVDSTADTVTIVAATANSAPMANAGADQNVLAGTTVFLDASGSTDADGDGLLYTWSFVAVPTESAVSFDNALAENPSFTPDVNGSYVINLIVNDGFEDSDPDSITIDAIEPSVKLFKQSSSFFNPTYNEVGFPYSATGTVSASVSGIPAPTTYSLATFKLVAEGQNFTIINLIADDSTSTVVPFFTTLSEGYDLADGTEVEFELVSPLTRGDTVTLSFSFEIQETGDTFSANYTFTSN